MTIVLSYWLSIRSMFPASTKETVWCRPLVLTYQHQNKWNVIVLCSWSEFSVNILISMTIIIRSRTQLNSSQYAHSKRLFHVHFTALRNEPIWSHFNSNFSLLSGSIWRKTSYIFKRWPIIIKYYIQISKYFPTVTNWLFSASTR